MRIEEIHRSLAGRLRERRSEIELATLARVQSVTDPNESSDPEYTEGLGAAVNAAIEYGIEAVEHGEERTVPIPTALLSQARLAARHGVKLETVLRRYLAGYTLLGDFLIEESSRGGSPDARALKRLLRVQAALLDRLIAAVSEEYAREAKTRPESAGERLGRRVQQLLEGRRLDTSDLTYDFDAVHQGVVARGPGAPEALREFASALDRRLLLIARPEDGAWAWLGGREAPDSEALKRLASSAPAGVSIAAGEPGQGLSGWRLTHCQAQAALPIALRRPEPFVRYADVALLASMLQDDLLASSLRDIYLTPLECGRDGGELARETLRAYFAAERNVASAAAALGVSRQAVAKRIRAVEEILDRTIGSCGASLEAVLYFEELEAWSNDRRSNGGSGA